MTLPYLRAGTGKPLVLVHGYLGASAQWQDQLDAFAGTHDVIAPDLPGFGQAAAHTGPRRIADFAAAVMACIDGLGVGNFTLLGHSMGGMIVQEIAARHTDRIDALLLYGTGPLGLMPDRFEPIETSMARLEADGVEATADRISATWFRDGNAAPGYGPTRGFARMAHPTAAHNALIAMRDWDGRAALPQLSMPCRILWGDRDRSYRWPQINALWNGIPGAELSVIADASHAAHMEKPKLFNAIVQDFLDPA
ncbi:alpha/beta fold hydrolase [Roseinatronobacter bogoriensis]|uniref:Alpha/beta hydrolase n=1 Tax=Roseinatronobacter bogoriensis subsp. barguzinensis TaxID=441209 RepID=A0A2K8KCX9_9RHOB|nr:MULTISPECIES: alpha/beta hydrolase [Rhodobaca]ATX67302.1 alpha/beta hydrolase [Rhodobaca barguzinensis]MBB4206862.1 pimeloyl-ACP methyl ester carboxylesterase [Rhodobaca bogoriensis DSM 18756]TDW41605.1 pimeloyl-ACP methyl ester carboxylesterase [Rhodobaca barguzinensis]TDY74216.1 pimeloyl-ACP methyl ester carboxylesterase [Rhodobaca bogoriensis DSM 18756]